MYANAAPPSSGLMNTETGCRPSSYGIPVFGLRGSSDAACAAAALSDGARGSRGCGMCGATKDAEGDRPMVRRTTSVRSVNDCVNEFAGERPYVGVAQGVELVEPTGEQQTCCCAAARRRCAMNSAVGCWLGGEVSPMIDRGSAELVALVAHSVACGKEKSPAV